MKFFIPRLGDKFRLASDWTFDLSLTDERNATLAKTFGHKILVGEWDPKSREYIYTEPQKASVTVPAGAVLRVDRIYIRKGALQFDSITFSWEGKKTEAREEEGYCDVFTTLSEGDPTPENFEVIVDLPCYFGPKLVRGFVRHKVMRKVPARPVRFFASLDDVMKAEFEEV